MALMQRNNTGPMEPPTVFEQEALSLAQRRPSYGDALRSAEAKASAAAGQGLSVVRVTADEFHAAYYSLAMAHRFVPVSRGDLHLFGVRLEVEK